MEDAKDASKASIVREEVLFEEDIITLVVKDQLDKEKEKCRFIIKKTEAVKKVYAANIGEKNPENLKLLINERRIQNDQTPQDLGLESGNVITVESADRVTIIMQGIFMRNLMVDFRQFLIYLFSQNI